MKAKIGVLLLLLTAIISHAQSNSQRGTELNVKNCRIQLPDLFEPNAETGIIMEVEHSGVQHFEMKIFNRWGVQVLESSMNAAVKTGMQSVGSSMITVESNGSEDVRYNQDLDNGAYFFTLETYCLDGAYLKEEGEINLIRTEKR